VTSLARSPFLPDVPTIAETVLPGFELLGWFGILAPAGTPLSIVARLNKELDDVLKQPDVRQQFATLGIEPYGGSIARFQQLVESDTQRVGAAIRRLGMTPN
jgi:tripartite-type tricarboxylate transporter receptor subunit TctC